MNFVWSTKKDPDRYSEHKMKQYGKQAVHVVFQCSRVDRTRTSFRVQDWKLYNDTYKMRWDRFVAMNELIKEHYPGAYVFVIKDTSTGFWKWSLRDKKILYPGDDVSLEEFEVLLTLDKL